LHHAAGLLQNYTIAITMSYFSRQTTAIDAKHSLSARSQLIRYCIGLRSAEQAAKELQQFFFKRS
jgi:hypothetical protein